jgi:hypothetical protein
MVKLLFIKYFCYKHLFQKDTGKIYNQRQFFAPSGQKVCRKILSILIFAPLGLPFYDWVAQWGNIRLLVYFGSAE